MSRKYSQPRTGRPAGATTPASQAPPPPPPPPGVEYITTDRALAKLLREVRGEPLLAIDTEAASFHRFTDRVYLIQLSSRSVTAIIDPLGVGDLSPVGKLLANSKLEVVFHDADYDLRLFDRDLGFHARGLFDTRIAAQFLHEPGIGLAALLDKYLGVKLDKKFQRADWSARPLTTAMLAYAATDTRYLPELRDILRAQLEERGRLSWAEEEFRLLEGVRWAPREDRGMGFLRMKGAGKLDGRSLAILRELYRWRESTARRKDKAAFRILNNQPMLALAQDPPADVSALGLVRGVGPEIARRTGRAIMAAVERGRSLADSDLPQRPRPERPRHDNAYLERLDRLKAVRNAVAERLDLDPGVVCPNGTLESIARGSPGTIDELSAIPAVRRWQAGEFGDDLLGAVAGS